MNFLTSRQTKGAVVKSQMEKLDASNAPELKSELLLLNKSGVNNIVIDLSATKYCDSSGLSAILTANRLCKDTNGSFVLCGLQSNVQKLIEIAQLDKVLQIADNEKLALEALNK
ncbi:MAG: STAS domain-containing protein [Bacteroidota bacterium]